jgi:type III pantothenate kinase
MSHLLVDMGNTDTVLALSDPSGSTPRLLATTRIRTHPGDASLHLRLREALAELRRSPGSEAPLPLPDFALVGSVVPSVTEALVGALTRELPAGTRVEVASPTAPSFPLRLALDTPRSLGVDRALNALAAYQTFQRNALVVDLGTATTYDCVTEDGVFLGGLIAPGVGAGGAWLESRAPHLPSVPFEMPTTTLGRSTEACLRGGIFLSALEGVEGIIRRMRAEWGAPDILVIATGGYASTLAPHAPSVHRVEPQLTLMGLALLAVLEAGVPHSDAPSRIPNSSQPPS